MRTGLPLPAFQPVCASFSAWKDRQAEPERHGHVVYEGLELGGEWAPFALVARPIVRFKHDYRKPLGSGSRLFFLRSQTLMRCEFANVREVLLKFIFSKAVHCRSPKKSSVSVEPMLQA